MYLTLIEENQLHKEELEDGLYPSVSFSLGLGLLSEKRSGEGGKEVLNTQHDAPLIDDTSNFSANLILTSGIKPLHLTKGVLNQHIRDLLQETQSRAFSSNLFIIPQFIARESDLALKPLQTEFF
jgi:hypothetical protein